MNSTLQNEPPQSNINHPPTEKGKLKRSPDYNMGVAQDIMQSLTWHAGRHNSRNHRPSDKILAHNVFSIFFNLSGRETLKPALQIISQGREM